MAQAPTSVHTFSILDGQQYMSLTTYRKNGQAVPTPVWFARVGDVLVITTQSTSGKVKRIGHTPRVTMAPCKMNGELLGSDSVEGTARLLNATESKAANEALTRKYGLMKRLFDVMGLLSRSAGTRVFLEIRPVG